MQCANLGCNLCRGMIARTIHFISSVFTFRSCHIIVALSYRGVWTASTMATPQGSRHRCQAPGLVSSFTVRQYGNSLVAVVMWKCSPYILSLLIQLFSPHHHLYLPPSPPPPYCTSSGIVLISPSRLSRRRAVCLWSLTCSASPGHGVSRDDAWEAEAAEVQTKPVVVILAQQLGVHLHGMESGVVLVDRGGWRASHEMMSSIPCITSLTWISA